MTRPVFIPLAAGLQTELTDQLVTPGATLLLQNCYGQQTGKTQPRGGAGVLSTADQATLPTGGTLPIAWQLATLGGSLVRFNRAPVPLHTWAATPEAWVQPAAATISGTRTYRKGPIKLDTSPVFSGAQAGDQVSDPTMAVSGDVIVYVYEPFGRTAVVIMDRLTRRSIFTRITGASTRCPKVVIVGTMAVVAYQNADGELQVDTYDLTTYTLSDSLDMEDIFVGSAFDIRVGASRGGANDVSVLFREVTTGFLRCAVVDATDLTDNDAYYVCDTAGTPANPDLGFGWMQDFGASGKFSVMFADTTDGLQALWDLPVPTGGFANAVSLHSLDPSANTAGSGSTPGFRNVIGSTTDSNALGHYRVLYEMTPPGFRTRALTKQVVWDGAAAVADDTIRAVGIRSKLWQHSTSFYFLSAFDGTDQRTYFAIAVSNTLTTGISYAAPLAVAFPRDAGGMTESTNAPSAAAVGPDGEIYVAVTSETRVESIASSGTATGGTSRMLAAEIVRMRHPAVVETEVGPPAEFLRSLFVPGGLLGHFDGSTYAAAGFAYFPPFFTAVAQAGGDLEEDATYRYRIVYSFVDRNGRKWRSAPSTPLTVGTITGEGKFELTIDTLRLIDRGQTNGNFGYQIEVYRTQANADQGFFLVATIFNSPVADTATLVDNVADTALGEQLYTDGNGVENQLLPAISWCVEQNGRLVCGESGTGTVWESVEADFNGGLIFNEALTFDVGDPAEPTTGAAVFGQTLFVFKAGKVYAVDGQGANALGQGSTRTVRLLDVGIGCSNPQSIVVADDGVWFRSSSDRAGIHRTAGGAPQYVGGGVRDQDGLTITGAVVVRSLSQIRFYTEEGTTLVWDWTAKLWSTNTDQPCGTVTTGYAGTSGVVYANAVDAYIMAEDAAVFVEGDEAYTAKLRTPWYQTAGIAGWERVKRIQGVGDVIGAHTAVIRLYRNMNETTPFQTVTRNFPTAGVRWDWELRPAQQKYSSLMIEVEITPYQPPDVTAEIEPDALDTYLTSGQWEFVNAAFTAEMVGGTITVAGSPESDLNDTFEITAVNSATEVAMTPAPVLVDPTLVDADSITLTYTPAPLVTAGAQIVGVSLIPIAKDGMDKLGSNKRAT